MERASGAETRRGCLLLSRYVLGSLLEPKLTFPVPFFGVREESDGSPAPALFSLHFSQLTQFPAAQVSQAGPGFWPTVAVPMPGFQAGQMVLEIALIGDSPLSGAQPLPL